MCLDISHFLNTTKPPPCHSAAPPETRLKCAQFTIVCLTCTITPIQIEFRTHTHTHTNTQMLAFKCISIWFTSSYKLWFTLPLPSPPPERVPNFRGDGGGMSAVVYTNPTTQPPGWRMLQNLISPNHRDTATPPPHLTVECRARPGRAGLSICSASIVRTKEYRSRCRCKLRAPFAPQHRDAQTNWHCSTAH